MYPTHRHTPAFYVTTSQLDFHPTPHTGYAICSCGATARTMGGVVVGRWTSPIPKFMWGPAHA